MKHAIRPRRSDPARQARIELMRDGAIVRAALGQAAGYVRLPDGSHQITLRGGRAFVAGTLEEVIELARVDA